MLDRIYLDSCVLNRPTDDQTQERIRQESAAIAQILDAVAEGQLEWMSSSILRFELSRNPDLSRRGDALDLLSLAATTLQPTGPTFVRAAMLRQQGYGEFDSLHLALAEEAQVSVLLTVDDRLIRRSALGPPGTPLIVENPVNWLRRRHPWLIKR